MKKINPLIYTGAEKQPTYWSIGEKTADSFKIGEHFEYNLKYLQTILYQRQTNEQQENHIQTMNNEVG